MSEGEIINKVAQSPLITFNLEDYLPNKTATLDLLSLVEEGSILRETEFRATLKSLDTAALEGAVVRTYCSEDMILPAWAPILLSSRLFDSGIKSIWAATEEMFWSQYFREELAQVDWETFSGKPIILKGCGDSRVPRDAYVQAIQYLKPLAKKVSYGEACSAVPLK
mgnify:CR=1 FL=1